MVRRREERVRVSREIGRCFIPLSLSICVRRITTGERNGTAVCELAKGRAGECSVGNHRVADEKSEALPVCKCRLL